MNPYYTTKTEFIREAIREKLKKLEHEAVLREIQRKSKIKKAIPLTREEKLKLFEEYLDISDLEILRKYNLENVTKS